MSRLELLLEAERRGLLPPDKRALLQEARRRGLVPGGEEEEPVAPTVAAEPERTIGGYAKEALKGLIPGAAGLAETAITGAAALLPEEAEQAVRRGVSGVVEPIREAFAPERGYEDTTARKLGEAVGSTIPFLPLGVLGAAGRAAAVGLGVGAGAGEARQRAEQEGATEGERAAATALGIGPGALEALPPIRILRRFGFGDEALQEVAGFVPALRRAAQAGGEEALQETSSQVLQNLIAKGVYAPDEAVFGGVGEAAAMGGGAGAIVSAIADLALGRRLRGRGAEEAPAEPAQPQELPPTEAAVPAEAVEEVAAVAAPPVELTPEERRDELERYARELRFLAQSDDRLRQAIERQEAEEASKDDLEYLAQYDAALRARDEARRRPLGEQDQMGLPLEGGAAQLDLLAPTELGQPIPGMYRPAEDVLAEQKLKPRTRAYKEEAKDLGLRLDRKGNLKPNQFVPEITSQVSPDQERFAFEDQKELPLTMPAPLEGQGDLFAEGVPIPTREQPRTDAISNSQVSWLPETEGVSEAAPEGQFALDLPGIPMERLAPRDRVLRAMSITEDKKNIPNLRFATQLRPMELQKTIGDLKNEGAIAFNKSANEWELTPSGVERVRSGPETKPPRRRRSVRVPVPPQGAEGPDVTGVGERGVAGVSETPTGTDVGEEPSADTLDPNQLYERLVDIRNQALSFVTKSGELPAVGSPERAQRDNLVEQFESLKQVYNSRRKELLREQTRADIRTVRQQLGLAPERREIRQQAARAAIDEITQRKNELSSRAIDALDSGEITEERYNKIVEKLKTPAPRFGDVEAMIAAGRGKIKYQQGETGRGIAPERIRAVADETMRGWTNPPEVVVVDKIPEEYKTELGKTLGAYKNGRIFVFAENAREDRLRGTILHESLGHYGLEQEFKEGLATEMSAIYKGNAKVRDAVAKLRAIKEYNSLNDADATEEVLAKLSEQGPIKEKGLASAVYKAISWIRNWLRKKGFIEKYTDNDIVQVLQQAHRRVTELKKAPYDPFDPQIRYQRSPAEQRKGDRAFINSIGKIPSSLPEATNETFQAAVNAASNVPPATRRAFYSMLNPHDMDRMYRKYTNGFGELWNDLNGEGVFLRKEQDKITENIQKWKAVLDKYSPAEQSRIFKIFMDTTVNQAEVLNLQDGKRNINWEAKTDSPIYKQFIALKPEVQEVYKQLRLAYLDYALGVENSLKQYLTPNEFQKLQSEFNAKRLPVYLPLFRKGKYKLKYVDRNKETVALQFESIAERDRAWAEAKREGATDRIYSEVGTRKENEVPPSGFFGTVVATLKKNKVDPAIINPIINAYLDLVPAQSVLQFARKRAGTAGYRENVLEAYANVGDSYARRLANMTYTPKFFAARDKVVTDLELAKANDQIDPDVAEDIKYVLDKQMEFIQDPKLDSLAAKASYFSYQIYLGANISTAIVNTLDIPTVVWSRLGGKHGFGKSFNSILKASSVFFSKNKSDEMRELIRRGLDTGSLREQQLQDIATFKDLDSKYERLKAGTERVTNWAFAKSDMFNRQVALAAAYDLNKKTPEGVFDENAFIQAQRTVYDVYGSSFPKASAPIMGNDIARTALTFKRFAIVRMNLLLNAYREATKDLDPTDPETPIIRKAARREILGYFGSAFVFAGVQGMPVVGAGMVLANLLNAALGDDDEPYNPEFELREAIGLFNYKGPINYLTGVDIASRTGWTGMFWREDPKRVAEVGPLTYTMEQILGPAYAYFNGWFRDGGAIDNFTDEKYQRGFEQILPRSVGNILKAQRYAEEGALTGQGVPLVDDVSKYNIFMQVFGFRPSDVAEAGEEAGAAKRMESKIIQRRNAIIERASVARMSGDYEGFQEAMEDARGFSQKHPARAITAETLYGAIKRRQKKMVESVNGVRVDPKLAREIYDELGIEPE